MENFIEFVRAALPWIAIGLFAAVNALLIGDKNRRKKMVGKLSKLNIVTLVCFIFVAVMEFIDGNMNSGVTFLIIGVVSFVVSILNIRSKS